MVAQHLRRLLGSTFKGEYKVFHIEGVTLIEQRDTRVETANEGIAFILTADHFIHYKCEWPLTRLFLLFNRQFLIE